MKALSKKDLNFARAEELSGKPSGKAPSGQGKRMALIVFPFLLLVAGLMVWGGLQWQYRSDSRKAENQAVQVGSILGDSGYRQALLAEKRMKELETEYRNAWTVRQALDSYPSLSQAFFQTILSSAGTQAEITGFVYSASDGLLVMTGTAYGILDTAEFVGRLRQTGLFESISYTGYTEMGESSADSASSCYLFRISAIVNVTGGMSDGE